MLRLSIPLVALSCATPLDDPLVPPDRGPTVYRKPDCPGRRTIAVRRPSGSLDEQTKLATMASGTVEGPLVVTHGGSGSKPELSDGPQAAAEHALAVLVKNGPPLEAAIAGTIRLEDDPRFNAGTGSNIRLDGKTIQMDASLMTDDGDFAAVAVIQGVKNPIQVARLVLDSPHSLIVGEGATRFARKLGVPDFTPVSDEAVRKYEERMTRLGELMKQPGRPIDWRAYWNFPGEMPADMKAWRQHGDTVGTVVRDRDGRFAATLSTGGTSVTLYGRVGDVPIRGAGLFVGPAGAVACTGRGESIVRHAVAHTVYRAMAAGTAPHVVLNRVIREFPPEASLGVIAVDRLGWAVSANREMAYGVAHEETEKQ